MNKVFKQTLIDGYKTVYRKAIRQNKRRKRGEILLSNTYKPRSIREYIASFIDHPILGETAKEMLNEGDEK